jgi:hypothetical protein
MKPPLLSSARRGALVLTCAGCALVAGCASIGPTTIARDRFDYIASISESLKRQTLFNLLKIRYADAPVFLDVASVINSYAREGELSVGGQVAPVGRGDSFFGLEGSGRYADRPTITYSPLGGDKFARGLLSPFPVAGVAYLIQSGYPVDAVLRICVNTINGLDNSFGSHGSARSGDARFAELLSILRDAQAAGAIAFRVRRPTEGEGVGLLVRSPSEYSIPMAKLLGVDPQAPEYRIVFGMFPIDDREIAVVTRSLLQVMIDYASYIDVPASDIAEQRVYAPARSPEHERLFPPLLRVHHGEVAPADAHVALRYRGGWFWIDDRDLRSKAALNILIFLAALTETGAAPGSTPIVTIPAR